MASTKCVGPAHPSEDDGEARRDLLGSSSSNTPSLDQLQAPPDDVAESDFAYFRRTNAKIRNRFPFPEEFSPADLAEAAGRACYVRAVAQRIPGQPLRRARWLLFCQGGTA
jgi:hypothetical protein